MNRTQAGNPASGSAGAGPAGQMQMGGATPVAGVYLQPPQHQQQQQPQAVTVTAVPVAAAPAAAQAVPVASARPQAHTLVTRLQTAGGPARQAHCECMAPPSDRCLLFTGFSLAVYLFLFVRMLGQPFVEVTYRKGDCNSVTDYVYLTELCEKDGGQDCHDLSSGSVEDDFPDVYSERDSVWDKSRNLLISIIALLCVANVCAVVATQERFMKHCHRAIVLLVTMCVMLVISAETIINNSDSATKDAYRAKADDCNVELKNTHAKWGSGMSWLALMRVILFLSLLCYIFPGCCGCCECCLLCRKQPDMLPQRELRITAAGGAGGQGERHAELVVASAQPSSHNLASAHAYVEPGGPRVSALPVTISGGAAAPAVTSTAASSGNNTTSFSVIPVQPASASASPATVSVNSTVSHTRPATYAGRS